MHYEHEGQWVESQEVIELLQGGAGAIARQGPLNVVFSPNINTAGAIDMHTPDGKRFRSHVLGLAYMDAATGSNVMIAEVKDSTGQLVAPNEVIYPDAFTDYIADIRYVWRKGSFEQDVILRQKPAAPEAYGLSSESTRLQVWTEFIEAPVGTQRTVVLREEKDPQRRLTMQEPDLLDHVFDFGATRIGPGKAFLLDHIAGANTRPNAPVGKVWATIEDRTFLIESVDYAPIKTLLDTLPARREDRPAGNGNEQFAGRRKTVSRAQWATMLPKAPGAASEKSKQRNIELAARGPMNKGLVIDYTARLVSTNNMVFRSDTTYYLSNLVSLSGTTIIEGGTVVKFAGAGIEQTAGAVECRTDAYRPAVFTSTEDNSVGETIPGSSNNPSVCYNDLPFACNFYFYVFGLGGTEFKYMHLRYAHMGLMFEVSGAPDRVSHSQFMRGQYALYGDGATIELRNVLMYEIQKGIIGSYFDGFAEHLTVHHCDKLVDDYGSASAAFALTNCLLVYLTNWGISTITNTNKVVKVDNAAVFQTVGAGAHYLAGETYRHEGTTNISPNLLAELRRQRTTYPPYVLTNTITHSTNLKAIVPRSTNAPDLGWHYAAVDFAANAFTVTNNSTLNITAGTAIALFGERAITLPDGGRILCEGTPLARNHFVRFHAVQEQSTNWGNAGANAFPISPLHGTTQRHQLHFVSQISMP